MTWLEKPTCLPKHGAAYLVKLNAGFVGDHVLFINMDRNNSVRKVASSADVANGEGSLMTASGVDISNPQFKGDNSFNGGRGNY